MPFIPHTEEDIAAMLQKIGVANIETLFDEIPKELYGVELDTIPEGMNELEVTRHMRELSLENRNHALCFIGAGAYEHHIPAAVWEVASRSEFLTAYTPYQAEASQGALQLIYEYQTMIANLMGMEVANASLYDGATALAEAVLMAVRSNRRTKSRRVLLPKTLHPAYRQTIKTIVSSQDIELVELDYNTTYGHITYQELKPHEDETFSAIVIPQPNYLGQLEDVDMLCEWAYGHNALAIACVNPISCAALKAPGQWGKHGADIAVGEGQPLGIPLASGGPYFGFMCTRQNFVRQMPGRIVGRTTDIDGKVGFTLTLQAREQHIRRGKATSNICTNQGLMVTAATIYMSLLGFKGMHKVSVHCHARTRQLLTKLQQVPGVERAFSTPYFHEAVITLPCDVEAVLAYMRAKGIHAGIAIEDNYPEYPNSLLVCVTETKNDADLRLYATTLSEAIEHVRAGKAPLK